MSWTPSQPCKICRLRLLSYLGTGIMFEHCLYCFYWLSNQYIVFPFPFIIIIVGFSFTPSQNFLYFSPYCKYKRLELQCWESSTVYQQRLKSEQSVTSKQQNKNKTKIKTIFRWWWKEKTKIGTARQGSSAHDITSSL